MPDVTLPAGSVLLVWSVSFIFSEARCFDFAVTARFVLCFQLSLVSSRLLLFSRHITTPPPLPLHDSFIFPSVYSLLFLMLPFPSTSLFQIRGETRWGDTFALTSGTRHTTKRPHQRPTTTPLPAPRSSTSLRDIRSNHASLRAKRSSNHYASAKRLFRDGRLDGHVPHARFFLSTSAAGRKQPVLFPLQNVHQLPVPGRESETGGATGSFPEGFEPTRGYVHRGSLRKFRAHTFGFPFRKFGDPTYVSPLPQHLLRNALPSEGSVG